MLNRTSEQLPETWRQTYSKKIVNDNNNDNVYKLKKNVFKNWTAPTFQEVYLPGNGTVTKNS